MMWSHLDVAASPGLTHDVLGLDVQVDDVLLVHVSHSLAHLAHVVDHLCLGHLVSRGGDALKQFSSR